MEEPTTSAKLTNRLIDHVMTCLEDIAGIAGKNSLRDRLFIDVSTFDKFKITKGKLISELEILIKNF